MPTDKRLLFNNESIIKADNKYYKYKNNVFTFSNIEFKKVDIQLIGSILTSNSKSFIIDGKPITYGEKIFKIVFVNSHIEELSISKYTQIELEINNSFIEKVKINNLNDAVSPTILKKEHSEFDNKISFNKTDISTFIITNSKFYGKLYFNKDFELNNSHKFYINELIINNTKYHNDFKLHNMIISLSKLKNIDFDNNADFFNSEFLAVDEKVISFKGVNFKSLAYFDNTTFKKKLVFNHVNFMGNSNFKNSILIDGLDLEYANIEKEINFHNMNIVNTKKTSQETFRIIKHQFEKLGNKIEANKYHSLELESRKDYLDKFIKAKLTDKLVFKFNWWSSRFMTRWDLPLFWMFLVAFVTSIYMNNNQLEIILNISTASELWDFLKNTGNEIFKYISILTKKDDFEDEHIAFVLNKVFLGYLYYQFVMATRKDTRK